MKNLNYSGCFGKEYITVNIAGNNQEWYNSVINYLSLCPVKVVADQSTLKLDLYVCSENELDQIIPLPGKEYLKLEKTLLVDRLIPNSSYTRDSIRWVDYQGFGRFKIDYGKKQAVATHLANSGISQVYADIGLGYNPFLGLLAGNGYYSVHASCARVAGKGMLFTGDSGSGKSTSAYALLRGGHAVLADDRILLKKTGIADESTRSGSSGSGYKAYSVSDVIKLDRKALKSFFPELEDITPMHRVKDELYYKAGKVEGLAYRHSTEVEFLLIFEKTGLPETRLERINPTRVVGDLFPVTMSNYESAAMEKKFAFLTDFLATVKCYKVYFGTDMKNFVYCMEKLAEEK